MGEARPPLCHAPLREETAGAEPCAIPPTHLVSSCSSHKFAILRQHLLCLVERKNDQSSQNFGTDRMKLEFELSNNRKITHPRLLEYPQNDERLRFAGSEPLAVRSDHVCRHQIVDGHAVFARQRTESAAQRQPGNAGDGEMISYPSSRKPTGSGPVSLLHRDRPVSARVQGAGGASSLHQHVRSSSLKSRSLRRCRTKRSPQCYVPRLESISPVRSRVRTRWHAGRHWPVHIAR